MNLSSLVLLKIYKFSNIWSFRNRAYTIPDHTRIDQDRPAKNYERRNYNPNYRFNSNRGNFRYSHYRNQGDNFRGSQYRKRNVYMSKYQDRQGDRKYPKSKFNHKFSSRGKAFEYKDKVGGFKAPKHLTTQQQKRRHLQHLRRTAAELATRDVNGFVYKPGMIGLLRPSTPRNTTGFLLRQRMALSPKYNVKEETKEKDRECLTVVDDKYDMTQYDLQIGSRTPEPKLSPLHL